MNKQEALKSDQQIKKYMQANKLRAMFSELTKQVLLARPSDPIQHLINYLSARNKRQVICIQGYDDDTRSKVSTSIANKFNYHLINLSSIFKNQDYHIGNDAIINETVSAQLKKTDAIYKGIVISGYPNNSAQCDYIQKSGILPQRYFVIATEEEAMRGIYSKKHDEEETNLLIQRNRLERKEMMQLLGDKADVLPDNADRAVEKIASAISLKVKKNVPFQAPRVFVLHPPFLSPKSLNALDKYCLHRVSIQSSFGKLAEKEQFQNYVGTHIRRNKCLSKQIELAMIETECKSAASKNKGFIVTGWPTKTQSLPFLKQHFLNPHIIFIFTAIKQKASDEFEKLDPSSPVFAICEKPSSEEYGEMFKEYEKVVEQLKITPNVNVQIMPLTESEQQFVKTFESLIDNPKIYS